MGLCKNDDQPWKSGVPYTMLKKNYTINYLNPFYLINPPKILIGVDRHLVGDNMVPAWDFPHPHCQSRSSPATMV